jgi:hypothetical protein
VHAVMLCHSLELTRQFVLSWCVSAMIGVEACKHRSTLVRPLQVGVAHVYHASARWRRQHVQLLQMGSSQFCQGYTAQETGKARSLCSLTASISCNPVHPAWRCRWQRQGGWRPSTFIIHVFRMLRALPVSYVCADW